jgi:phosphopantothenoylcysteine decarboxylase/phosphopantothenate--cysteine ligase
MYRDMYTHPATQAHLSLLRERGAYIVEPEVGRLASGAIGPGRLPETEVLLGAIRKLLGRAGDLAGRHVLVTAGGTHEPIDPVRYIGNRSSGKMGYALATEARDRGAHVILVSGPVALSTPYGVEVCRVETAIQMRDAVHAFLSNIDVLIMSAAVADFRPASPAQHKIKKDGDAERKQEQIVDESGFSVRLVKNPDILGELAGAQQRQDILGNSEQPKQRLVRVGFAAETNDIITYARSKLVKKRLDLLVANDVSRSDSGFGADTNKVLILSANGGMEDLPVMPKTGVAAAIWDRVVSLLHTTT